MRYSVLIAVLAIVVGGLYAAPQLLIRQAVVAQELPFILSQFTQLHDGGDAYLQYAREVYDGHFPPSDLFFDYRTPNIFPPLPPLAMAGLIFLFKDISVAYIAANFLFSAILFLLFLLLGWVVFNGDKIWSVFMGLVGTLTPIAIHLPYAFFDIDNFANVVLKNFYPAVKTFLPTLFMARIEYPLLTHLVYLPAIIVFFVFWRRPRLITAVAAGFLAGLLFYTYLHKWAYWVVVIGLAFLYALVFRRQNKRRLLMLAVLIGMMILTGIPYFINYFEYNSLPGAQDQILRLHLEIGRNFNWLYWPHYLAYLLLGGLVYLFFWRRAEFKDRAVLYWIFLTAAFLVWNVQLITGFVPHSDHWPRAVSPLFFLVVSDLIYSWVKTARPGGYNFRIILSVLMVVLAVSLVAKKVVNVLGFISPSPQILKDYTFPVGITSSWRWIDLHLDEPRVISPSFLTSTYLTAFTSARPFLPIGIMVPAPNFQLEEKFLETNKVFDVDQTILEKRLWDGQGLECREFCDRPYIENNVKSAPYFLYGLYFTDNAEPRPYKLPEYKIRELVERYQGLRVGWADMGSGYVYYGPWEKQFSGADLSWEQKLRLVYKNSSVELYQIR